MIGNCKDCDWWVNCYCKNDGKIGECLCSKNKDNIDQLSYSYNEGGAFQTGPMFGCVHFKEKKINA
jgi:hypothetical protein